jgi:hypothetical protein
MTPEEERVWYLRKVLGLDINKIHLRTGLPRTHVQAILNGKVHDDDIIRTGRWVTIRGRDQQYEVTAVRGVGHHGRAWLRGYERPVPLYDLTIVPDAKPEPIRVIARNPIHPV